MHRPFKILQVGKFYPPHKGGMETHLYMLCKHLQSHIHIEVLVANDTRDTIREVVDGIKVTRVGQLFTFSAASFCPQMAQAIRDSEADIVHIHLPNPTAVLAYLSSGHKGRLIVTYHSDVLRQKTLAKAFAPILEQLLHRAALIICTSPNYIKHSPVLSRWRERCCIIPFGIESENFLHADPNQIEAIRSRFGPRIVLSVGRLVYYKGFTNLLEAMQHVNGRLVIIGDGPLRQELQSRIVHLGLDNRISILGGVEDVLPFYHASDVFALPSIARTEAFGIVQLEAMASGKPVVNTNIDSGVPFVSQHGLTGITVSPGDVQALAQALQTLLDDPLLAASYGAAARQRVANEFSLERMCSQTLKLYQAVVGLSHATAPSPSQLSSENTLTRSLAVYSIATSGN